ncbi:UNVERIFIED_CONTAM: hypothetical protein FKN15_059147 [Acipenser sinensis]
MVTRPWDRLERKELVGHQANLALKEYQACLVLKELQGIQDLKILLENLGELEKLDFR